MDDVQVSVPAPQHMRALARANRVRLARSELKRRIKDGETTVAEVVTKCPWEAETMPLFELLQSQHRWGRARCRRFLASFPMAENKVVGSLTERQRHVVVARLAPDAPAEEDAFGLSWPQHVA